MAMDEKKRKYLTEVFGEEYVKSVEADLKEVGDQLDALGISSKALDFGHVEDGAEPADKDEKLGILSGLVSDLIADLGAVAETVTKQTEGAKALDTRYAEFETRLKAVEATAADRPKGRASTDEETTLTEDLIEKLFKKAKEKEATGPKVDKFTGLPLDDEEES